MCCKKKKNVSGKPHTLPYVFTLEQWHSTRISLLIGYIFFFFFYNSLTLSCLLPQDFSHSSSLRTNCTQSWYFVLSQLVIRPKKQEQEQEQEPEPEPEQEKEQEQEKNKNQIKFSDFFFFFFFSNGFDHNQTNKQLMKPEQ
jgi:hypothetical protein